MHKIKVFFHHFFVSERWCEIIHWSWNGCTHSHGLAC